MTIHYREQGSAIIVLGNTYPYRDQLKALGARFNGEGKNWRIPLSPRSLGLVAELCAASGGGSLSPLPVQTFAADSAMATGGGELSLSPSGEATGLSVRQLMERIEQVVTAAFPQALWVTGEVQNCSQKTAGVFFDLAEGRSEGHANATLTVRAIIWQGVLNAITERRGEDKTLEVLQDGMKIRCLCQVQVYKDRGTVSLLVTDIDPSFTKGALALAREKLLKELRAKGLDQANKRLPMPSFPLRIGLVSADGSRAKADFLDQLMSLQYPGTVVFCPAVMQGEQVPRQVVRAMQQLTAAGCDLIVLTRGGGSAADLRWFDAAEIAYAIALASVPVIAAIGHHEDICVAEEVCFLRQKTPTAAADFVISIGVATRQRIDALAKEMAAALVRQVDEVQQRLSSAAERIHATAKLALEQRGAALTSYVHHLQRGTHARIDERSTLLNQRSHTLQRLVAERLHQGSVHLTQLTTKMQMHAERSLGGLEQRQLQLTGALQARDPSSWLAQGWTQLSTAHGRLVSVAQVGVGDELNARLKDGRLRLRVEATHPTTPAKDTIL